MSHDEYDLSIATISTRRNQTLPACQKETNEHTRVKTNVENVSTYVPDRATADSPNAHNNCEQNRQHALLPRAL